MYSLSRRRFLSLLPLLPTAASAQIIGNNGWSIRGTDPVEIFHGDRRVTSYHAGYGEGLPFFHPVVGPAGGVMTTASSGEPSKTARGLWLALADANGYDFRPTPDPGKKRGKILHKGMNGVHIQKESVALRMKAEWLDAADETHRICSDQRELTCGFREDGAFVLDVAVELIADGGDLAIGTDPTGVWTMQILPALMAKKEMGALVKDEKIAVVTAQSGAQARWVTCQGKDAKGVGAGVLVLDHPTNPGSPATWTIQEDGLLAANPFPVGSESPHTIPNGSSVRLRYRTIFYQTKSDTGIDAAEAFEQFAKS